MLALAHDVLGPAYRAGRIDRDHLADHQPVEQMAERGELLFDGRRGDFPAQGFNPGGDMERLHGGERTHAVRLAPGEEFRDGPPVGFAGIAVADVRGEEIDEAPRRGLAAGGDQRG